MGKCGLSEKLYWALVAASHLNHFINIYAEGGPAVVAGGIVLAYIYNNTEGVRVAAKCEGCSPGRRHYRIATPKALSKKNALYCRMCPPEERTQKPVGVSMPYPSEQSFIAVLRWLGVDEMFVYHVVPEWWGHSMDFYNLEHQYFVQIDGSCHWKGMHNNKCEEVLKLDFSQAYTAIEYGATLVRIHEGDVSNGGVVARTLAAAQGFVGVVLSPCYASQWVPCRGKKMLYTEALVHLNPNLAQNPTPTGVTLIHTM
jgi:hypothetical protein